MSEDILDGLSKITEYITLKARLEGRPCLTCGRLQCNGFHSIAYWCDRCQRLHGIKQICPKIQRLT